MSNDSNEVLAWKNRKSIDRSIRKLFAETEHENTLLPQTPAGQVQRVLKAYRQVKPVLTMVSSLSLIPSNWRAGLVVFTGALDALTRATPQVTAHFKAGKDL